MFKVLEVKPPVPVEAASAPTLQDTDGHAAAVPSSANPLADPTDLATEQLVHVHISEGTRDDLSVDSLGENVSVNIAFVRILEKRAQIYTMVEEKNRDKMRNCQGGYMDISLGDRDVFDAAAREAYEETEPVGLDAAAWQLRMSNMLRDAYKSRSPELSTQIVYKPMRYNSREFIGVHVSFRLIKQSELWDELGLVVKEHGSTVAHELTSGLRWDFLEDIRSQSNLFFTFNISDADINANKAAFVSNNYTDGRIGRVVKSCATFGCQNTFFDDRGQRLCKSCHRARGGGSNSSNWRR